MNLGISTACFFNDINTENTFDILKKMNVYNTEVFLNTFYEYEKPFVQSLVERKGNIKVHSVHPHGTNFEPELFSNNERQRTDSEVIFRKVCAAGNLLGAKYYTFHGPTCLKKIPYSIDYEKFAEKLNNLIDIAESYSMQIAYENVHWAYFNNPEFFAKVKELCPKLKATFDIKQAKLTGINYNKFLDVMQDRIVTIHICDMIKNQPMMPFSGTINFEKLFANFVKRGIDADIFVEVYRKNFIQHDELADVYNRLNDILKSVKNK